MINRPFRWPDKGHELRILFKRAAIFSTLILLFSTTYAQSTVRGTVKDTDGMGLPGAAVMVQGTSRGTTSDLNGNFAIETLAGDQALIVSFVGYTPTTVTLDGRSTYDVVLKSGELLEEVVVTALGVKRSEKSLGYAIQTQS